MTFKVKLNLESIIPPYFQVKENYQKKKAVIPPYMLMQTLSSNQNPITQHIFNKINSKFQLKWDVARQSLLTLRREQSGMGHFAGRSSSGGSTRRSIGLNSGSSSTSPSSSQPISPWKSASPATFLSATWSSFLS